MEDVVFDIYSSKMSKHHPQLTLRKSGMYIGEPGYLGASPDGILVNDTNTICGILEIKCPYSAAKLTVKEACSLCNDFYCYLNDNGGLNLKENHAYYYQVQGTMAITKADFCDFTIWTPKSMEIIRIKFNSHVWETVLPVLKNFYMQYMLPCVLLILSTLFSLYVIITHIHEIIIVQGEEESSLTLHTRRTLDLHCCAYCLEYCVVDGNS